MNVLNSTEDYNSLPNCTYKENNDNEMFIKCLVLINPE